MNHIDHAPTFLAISIIISQSTSTNVTSDHLSASWSIWSADHLAATTLFKLTYIIPSCDKATKVKRNVELIHAHFQHSALTKY